MVSLKNFDHDPKNYFLPQCTFIFIFFFYIITDNISLFIWENFVCTTTLWQAQIKSLTHSPYVIVFPILTLAPQCRQTFSLCSAILSRISNLHSRFLMIHTKVPRPEQKFIICLVLFLFLSRAMKRTSRELLLAVGAMVMDFFSACLAFSP